jgi:hypothetical protein
MQSANPFWFEIERILSADDADERRFKWRPAGVLKRIFLHGFNGFKWIKRISADDANRHGHRSIPTVMRLTHRSLHVMPALAGIHDFVAASGLSIWVADRVSRYYAG